MFKNTCRVTHFLYRSKRPSFTALSPGAFLAKIFPATTTMIIFLFYLLGSPLVGVLAGHLDVTSICQLVLKFAFCKNNCLLFHMRKPVFVLSHGIQRNASRSLKANQKIKKSSHCRIIFVSLGLLSQMFQVFRNTYTCQFFPYKNGIQGHGPEVQLLFEFSIESCCGVFF